MEITELEIQNKWIAIYMKVHKENQSSSTIASKLVLKQCKKLGGGTGRPGPSEDIGITEASETLWKEDSQHNTIISQCERDRKYHISHASN